LKLYAAVLLNAGLFDRDHLAFELRKFCGLGTVTADKECRRPKDYNGNASGDLVIGAFAILCAGHLRCPSRHALGFLCELWARMVLI
jgi:hypothetical protein